MVWMATPWENLMKRILEQNSENCNGFEAENVVNSAMENVMEVGFTAKQIAEKLNVSKKTIQRAVRELNCDSTVAVGRGGAKVYSKEQANRIADYVSKGRKQQTEIAQARTAQERYVASNETLTQIVSMLAEGQKETRSLIYQMQENQTKNFEILERILLAKESDYVQKANNKPLSEMWIPSDAILQNYKNKLTGMGFSSPKAVTIYLKSKAYDESVFRLSENMDSRGYKYYEFRADFVKDVLN